jgi:hypothetical protein
MGLDEGGGRCGDGGDEPMGVIVEDIMGGFGNGTPSPSYFHRRKSFSGEGGGLREIAWNESQEKKQP